MGKTFLGTCLGAPGPSLSSSALPAIEVGKSGWTASVGLGASRVCTRLYCLSPAPASQGLCGAKESGSLAARVVAL